MNTPEAQKTHRTLYAVAVLVLLGIAVMVAWHFYSSTPGYQAQLKLRQADSLADTSEIHAAATLYVEVASGDTEYVREAHESLARLLQLEQLERVPITEAGATIVLAISLCPKDDCRAYFPDLYGIVEQLASTHLDSAPGTVFEMLDATTQLAPDQNAHQAQHRLALERTVARSDADIRFVERLALAYESEGRFEDCHRILEPRMTSLGDGEGARILGQIYAANGVLEKAHALLVPYTESRLENYHAAEKTYNAALDELWERMIEDLNNDKGSDEFYAAYEKADEAGRQILLDEQYTQMLERDATIAAKLQAYRAAAEVVPVALDLGIITLRRAQTVRDDARRNEELKRAEWLFLAVRGAAGETDEFRLYLGQVYYWLGKHDEGRALLEDLITANGRSAEILYQISGILRELGDISTARAYAIESYGRADDPRDKQGIAQFVSLIASTPEEKIDWLEKADTSTTYVRADLHYQKAIMAEFDQDDTKAIDHYKKAIELYAGVPESPATLNNSALILFRLSALTGENQYLTDGVDRIDAAIALEPSDRIILTNAANQLIQAAYTSLIADRIDLVKLKATGDSEVLAHLYDDETAKSEMMTRLGASRAVERALAYLDTVMVLAPKSTDAFEVSAQLFYHFDDVDGLKRIRDRLASTEVDREDYLESVREYLAGDKVGEYLESFEIGIPRQRTLIDSIDAESDPDTFAYAVSTLIQNLLAASQIGYPMSPDEVLGLAQKNYKSSPSSATRSDLIDAHAMRAIVSLARADSEFEKLVGRHLRTHGHRLMLVVALESPVYRAALIHDRDVDSAVRVVREQSIAFPGGVDPLDWAMVRHVDPVLGEKMARAIRTNERLQISQEISEVLYPFSPSIVYSRYWSYELQGDKAAGIRYLDEKSAMPDLLALPHAMQ